MGNGTTVAIVAGALVAAALGGVALAPGIIEKLTVGTLPDPYDKTRKLPVVALPEGLVDA